MDKLKLAHDWAMKSFVVNGFKDEEERSVHAWKYADAMQAEAEKRKKAEAAQKRKEIREMLNAPNTFVEREGQHFDDVADIQEPYTSSEEWQPDWSQAPDGYNWFCVGSSGGYGFFSNQAPELFEDYYFVGADGFVVNNHGYQGNWQDSLRERPNGK